MRHAGVAQGDLGTVRAWWRLYAGRQFHRHEFATDLTR